MVPTTLETPAIPILFGDSLRFGVLLRCRAPNGFGYGAGVFACAPGPGVTPLNPVAANVGRWSFGIISTLSQTTSVLQPITSGSHMKEPHRSTPSLLAFYMLTLCQGGSCSVLI